MNVHTVHRFHQYMHQILETTLSSHINCMTGRAAVKTFVPRVECLQQIESWGGGSSVGRASD